MWNPNDLVSYTPDKGNLVHRQSVVDFLAERQAAREYLGTKHSCDICHVKFYDLNQEVVCPKC